MLQCIMAKIYSQVIIISLLISENISLCFHFEKQWRNFKIKFNKKYGEDEAIIRHDIWLQNLDFILQHNIDYDLGLKSYKLGLNEYSDLNHTEFIQKMCASMVAVNRTTASVFTFNSVADIVLPDYVDWKKKGYVTKVKHQRECGAAWAFSATGALEGQQKRKTNRLVTLSEQNLIDCSKSQGNKGCGEGSADQAFEYVKLNAGIDTEESYSYVGKEGPCRFNSKSVGATCYGFVDLPSGDEKSLQHAIATIGPISVVIDASSRFFQFYRDGVYDNENCSSDLLNMPVLVVGYGSVKDGADYWLIKNSWGTSWGIGGYIKMSRNKKNQCGVATLASYPQV
ncbi:cathepsin L1-like isoform X2 [Centruroides sculpturatus]|uniref:cathepsin L1-like isoform X2 n=1 Tax=Centruroides sculpturatus TaxID=218467 RepID=UPI000C6DECE7|nr:cathepsin L1-like isoform X2 [Centruroides sculpturatus]